MRSMCMLDVTINLPHRISRAGGNKSSRLYFSNSLLQPQTAQDDTDQPHTDRPPRI